MQYSPYEQCDSWFNTILISDPSTNIYTISDKVFLNLSVIGYILLVQPRLKNLNRMKIYSVEGEDYRGPNFLASETTDFMFWDYANITRNVIKAKSNVQAD